MKAAILLNAQGNEKWIGGLYYIKNVAFQLSCNKTIVEKYRIVICVSPENADIYKDLPNTIDIVKMRFNDNLMGKLLRSLRLKKLNVKIAYPFSAGLKKIGIQPVEWIADFQHNCLPQFFEANDVILRNENYMRVAKSPFPLVLSSNDCLKDFKHYYLSDRRNIYVMPFVSYIEPEIRSLTAKEKNILSKFGLQKGKYAIISNQFWKHKNHIVVFMAIDLLAKKSNLQDFKFVFTGKPEDYRDRGYYNEILKYTSNIALNDWIDLLGFIGRTEQIALMKNAKFVIQPSLFEGWGTVVEDAKVLDQRVLLSDIPVHREQMNENCILFDPKDPYDLASKIEEMCKEDYINDVEKGIADMYKRAALYSREFEKMLEEI